MQVMITLANISRKMENPFTFSVCPPPVGIPASDKQMIQIGVATPGVLLERYPKVPQMRDFIENIRALCIDEGDYVLQDNIGMKFLEKFKAASMYKQKDKKDSRQYIFCAATLAAQRTKKHKVPRGLFKSLVSNVQEISSQGVHSTLPSTTLTNQILKKASYLLLQKAKFRN